MIFALVFVSRDFELGRNVSVDFRNFFPSHLHEIRYIGTGYGSMIDARRYAAGSKVEVTSPSKFEFLPFSTSISSAIYNLQWQLANDH